VKRGAAVSAKLGGGAAGHAVVCRHCGSPLFTEAARTSGFCCAGCAYIFRLVSERGLDRYYTLKDKVTAPAGSGLFQPRDYGWLEGMQWIAEVGAATPPSPSSATRASRFQSPPEMVLDLQGISCVGCVWLIEKLFDREPGARHIEINAQLGRIRLTWKSGEFDATRFARTLQSFNYFLGPPGPDVAGPPESRDLVKRIGLCTAFAMNIMLFTLPAYFGMDASFPYARLFGTLAMVFGTLSFLAGGGYFLGRAAAAVRARVVHIDLPIALGILGAYGGSVYGWLATDGRFVYFDFVGTFILLMLVGRGAQVAAVERNRRQLLRHQFGLPGVRVYDAPEPAASAGFVAASAEAMNPAGLPNSEGRARPLGAPLTTDGPAVRPYLQNDPQGSPARDSAPLVAVDALQTGQVFGIPMGHTVPVEGRLVARDGVFTTAWINGESEPRVFRVGQRVPSGAVNVTRSELRLEALQTWSESLLARLLQGEVRPGFRHRRFERIIQGYLVGIIGLALAGGGAWAFASGDVQRALSVALSVLVVACPCAIGLALPLADEMAVTSLRRAGVFVRENDLWARLGRVRKIIFDKTGTLTLESPGLANPEALDALGVDDQRSLWTMVCDNPHPVSQCLCEALLLAAHPGVAFAGSPPNPTGRQSAGYGGSPNSAVPAEPAAGNVFEEIGAGIGLRLGGDLWTLGRPGWRGAPGRCETPGAENLEGGGLSPPRVVAPSGADGGLQAGQGEARDDVQSTTPVGDLAGKSEAGETEFCRNGAVLVRFRFADTVRADARVEIAALRAAGYEVFILSGDHQSKVDAMARELGLPEEHGAGDVSPEGKADWLRRHDRKDTLMLGDGANDSLAFTCAHCRGTPMVHRGALESKADFYYLGMGIGGIRRLLAVDRVRARTQRWVLGFAIAYNLGAVGCALAGHMNPLLAAGLMPASALVSLAIVGLGMRKGARIA